VTRLLYRIASWCARHAIWVIIAWVTVLIGLNGLNQALPPAGQQEFSLSGTDSAAALTLMTRAFPGTASDANPLVISGGDDLSTGSGLRTIKRLERTVAELETVATVGSPRDNPGQLSEDQQTALIMVTVVDRYVGDPDIATEILDLAEQAAPHHAVALGGLLGSSISEADTQISERLGLLAAVVVLLLTLRGVWAAAIPLINAIVTISVGIAIVELLGRVVLIPTVAPVLGTMLGLGVGIDYALFLVIRHRTLLRKGFETADAAGRTAGTSGAGIVFAGTTLILALSGLALTGISFLAWMGFAAAIVVAVAVLASATLVPAILGLLGRRVLRNGHGKVEHENDDHLDHGMWARIADSVTARPWVFTIGSVAILLTMAAPMLTMSFGQTDAGDLPKTTTAYQANQLMVSGFGAGSTGPLLIATQMNRAAEAPKDTPADPGTDPRSQDPRLERLQDDLANTPGIESVGDAFVSPGGGVAAIRVTPNAGPADPATAALIANLREEVLPTATYGEDMDAHVGGASALYIDLTGVMGNRLPYFILGVVTLSGLLLMIAYRSIVIPVKAAAMNLLSIAAAYGVVVAVFDWGWGSELLGLEELVPIETFIPMMMFAVLFGLSMDYEVFLLTAFREQWAKTGDMTVSVRRGLTDTGQVVTSAAAIMVVVFASFILVPDPVIKMFGVGLATAVLVDATIVRSLLVPALMVLAAQWTWWLPNWLDRALPELHVEGDPAALETIGEKPEHHDPETTAKGNSPSTAVLPVAIGVVIAWIVGSRFNDYSPMVSFQDVAIAISAIVGGIVVWLPAGMPGAGRARGTRLAMLVAGASVLALVYTGLSGLIPHTSRVAGQTAAWGLLLLALLIVLTPVRRYGLPLIFGGIVMAVTLGVGADDIAADDMALIRNALLPALLAGFLAILIDRIVSKPKQAARPDDSDSPSAADEDAATPAKTDEHSEVGR
jgi:RND superfamily putative drug exporter